MTREQKSFILAMTLCCGFVVWMARDLYKTAHEAPQTHIEVVYDCRLAEISPDYPVVVKEKCRKIMVPVISRVK